MDFLTLIGLPKMVRGLISGLLALITLVMPSSMFTTAEDTSKYMLGGDESFSYEDLMGLEFKLGSEILRTVIVRELSEIATVAAIIVLRAALTFLIHWEIKVEKADDEEMKEASR